KLAQGQQSRGVGRGGRAAQSYFARLDSGKSMNSQVDQASLFPRLTGIAALRKSRDGVRDRVVETTIHGAKFVYCNRRVLFDGQLGYGLTDIPVFVDDLVHRVSTAEQCGA